MIERIRLDRSEGIRLYTLGVEPEDLEYRLDHYTLGGYRSGKGHWLWGQYSPMIPKTDFDELLSKARAEGTLVD